MSYPPPTKVDDAPLPDFYLNTLIYEDTTSGDSCRWVVYDGLAIQRFPRRTDAIRWIENHRSSLPIPRDRLERCLNRIDAAWRNLDFEAAELPQLEKSILERISLNLRKTSEALAAFIRYYIAET